MMEISHIPLSVLNRALDLYGQPTEETAPAAHAAIESAGARISVEGPMSPLGQAIAEYMSAAGPWGEGGEHEDESGYQIRG
jgi:hypothetical protein